VLSRRNPELLRRRLAAGLALAALAAALAGCGVASSLDPVASAATKSQNAGSAHLTFSMTLSSPGLAGGANLELSGSGQVAGRNTELTLDMSQLLRAAGAPAGTDGTVTETFVSESGDAILYLHMALLDGKLPGGKHWLKLDLSQASKSLGIDVDKLLGQANTDPAQMLALLRATSGQVKDLGTETIAGDPTTHYSAIVDLTKAAKLAGMSAGTIQQLESQTGTTEIPEDVWIGSDGLVRQFRMAYGVTSNGTPMHVAMTIGMSGYGSDVTVQAPPADDVYDATAAAVQGLKSTTNP
jgi:hypothetical protein